MADADLQEIEQLARLVCIETCGPSPDNRLLYHAGLVYDALPAEEVWLISNGYAYVEGETPPATNRERKAAALMATQSREQAEQRMLLQLARGAREIAAREEADAEAFAQEEARQRLLAARADRKARRDSPDVSSDALREAREMRDLDKKMDQEDAALAQEGARQRLIAARKARG